MIKRVVIISKEFPPKKGGATTHTYYLAKGLSLQGIDVHVICDTNFKSKYFTTHKVFNINLPILLIDNLILGLFARKCLNKLTKKYDIDVIHVHNYTGIFLNKFRNKIKFICTLHDTVKNEYDSVKLNNLMAWVEKYLVIYPTLWLEMITAKQNNKIITVSQNSYKALKNVFPNNIFYIIPNGLPVIKSKLKNNKKKHKILFVGRLTARKGLKYLIKAMVDVVNIYPYTKLNIVGNGYEANTLKKFRNNLNLSKNIEFSGEVTKEKLKSLYSESTLFALPSLREGFCIVLLEAMMNGLPTIVTNCGGIKEVINKNTSLVVPIKNSKMLAIAIKEVISNQKLYTSMSRAALDNAQNFTYQKMAKKTIAIYSKK